MLLLLLTRIALTKEDYLHLLFRPVYIHDNSDPFCRFRILVSTPAYMHYPTVFPSHPARNVSTKQLQITRDTDTNVKTNDCGETLFICAVDKVQGHEDVVRLLIERDDVDINAKDTPS